jgi:DNA polymerase-3 subunit epsilon
MSDRCIVIDFETTGLSPGSDRAIEVAAVLLEKGRIRDRFQTLMNPGKKIPSFIESYTGITNDMLLDAPSNTKAMKDLASFIGKDPLVAHNASFDKRFLDFELRKAGKNAPERMACSLLVSRRIYDKVANYKLQTLVEFKKLNVNGAYHRALADAEVTALLWLQLQADLEKKFKVPATYDFMHDFGKTPKAKLKKFVEAYETH